MKIFLLICVLLAIWAFVIEPRFVVVKRYKLSNPDLAGCRFVLFGDIHIAPWQKKRLSRIVRRINSLKADVVLSTGDFVSGYLPHKTLPIEEIGAELSAINSTYGKFTVLGNHDWWQNGAQIREALNKNGIKVLENSSVKLDINSNTLTIAGVEDLQTRIPNPSKALRGAVGTTILLTHNPDVFFDMKENVYLTLAGHNHGGQVRLPFLGALIVPSKFGRKYACGKFKHGENTLIVTKGLGNSILNVRFCCLPEIVLIEFV